MSRFEIDQLPKKQRIKLIAELYDALGEVENRDQAKKVFRDLFTVSEIAMMSRRIQIALLLMENYTFEEISEILKVSKSTVSRINKKLERQGEGFKIMKKNFEKIQKRRSRKAQKKSPGLSLDPYQQLWDAEKIMTGTSIMDLIKWIKRKKNKPEKNSEEDKKEKDKKTGKNC